MKKALLGICAVFTLAGCGVSQKQLRDVDSLLTQAQAADCDTIKGYLAMIQAEIQKKIK